MLKKFNSVRLPLKLIIFGWLVVAWVFGFSYINYEGADIKWAIFIASFYVISVPFTIGAVIYSLYEVYKRKNDDQTKISLILGSLIFIVYLLALLT